MKKNSGNTFQRIKIFARKKKYSMCGAIDRVYSDVVQGKLREFYALSERTVLLDCSQIQ